MHAGEQPRRTSNRERCRDLLFSFVRDASGLLRTGGPLGGGEGALEALSIVSEGVGGQVLCLNEPVSGSMWSPL